MSRLRVYIEPRDAWVGVYVAPRAVYVCPLPFLVIRWQRRGAEIAQTVPAHAGIPGSGPQAVSVDRGAVQDHLRAAR